MGERNKPKKFSKMNYQQKQIYMEKQGDKYGVNKSDFDTSQGGGGGRYDTFNSEAYEKAVMKAANNDYDNREALKYGADSDNEHFKGLSTKGLSNAGELVALDRAMQKYGKKELGQTNTSSANDFGNISRSLFNESRTKFSDDIKADFDDEQTETAIKPDDNEVPYEESQQSKDAKATLDKWKAGLGPGGNISPYGPSSPSAPNVPSPYGSESSTPVTTNVDEFVDGYKKDVKAAYNFQPTLG
jgi:hypothetical protein